jgi:hypothetical protein
LTLRAEGNSLLNRYGYFFGTTIVTDRRRGRRATTG